MNMKNLIILLLIILVVYLFLDKHNQIAPMKDRLTGTVQSITGQENSDMTLEQALASGKPVIAKLGASWCPPCRQMAPIIEELKSELAGRAIVLDIDIEKRQDLASKYNARYIPLTLFFDSSGRFITSQVGFMTKQQVLDKFNSM